MSKSISKNLLIIATVGLGCVNSFVALPSFAQKPEVVPTTPTTPSNPSTSTPSNPSTSTPSNPSTSTPSNSSNPSTTSTETKSNTIVDVASSNKSFSILVTALKAAGLVETLSGKGPFTVFAPTDEAFKALPQGTLEMLLKPENKAVLVKVLTYHVVAGKVMAEDVKPGNVKTVEGSPFTVKVDSGMVMINAAKVTQTDVPASNGVIHVLDKVIVPPNL
jgi:uncharacterized surface protein with fasciclin (FAS1) repeats